VVIVKLHPNRQIDKFQFQQGNLTPYLQTTNTALSISASDGYDYISVVKKSNNIGLKESLDAKIYAYSSTKSGVYFTSGNTYDFTTGTSNGTHSLYGQVPQWGVVGNYIKIGSNFYFIEEIIYVVVYKIEVAVDNFKAKIKRK
jgi:hypothetical protein